MLIGFFNCKEIVVTYCAYVFRQFIFKNILKDIS